MLSRRVCCPSSNSPHHLLRKPVHFIPAYPRCRTFRAQLAAASLSLNTSPPVSFLTGVISPFNSIQTAWHSTNKNMSLRRSKSSSSSSSSTDGASPPTQNGHAKLSNGHTHPEHDDGDAHSHTHSHSIFGSHSHGEDGHIEGHEKIMQALQGSGEYWHYS